MQEPMTGNRAEKIGLRVLQIGAIAVVIAASTYKSFELDRYFVPKDLVLHVTALLALLTLARAIKRSAASRVDILLIAYLALAAASSIFAQNHWLALRATCITASGIALFWCARSLRENGYGRALLAGVSLAVVLGAMTALLQTYGVRLDIFSINRAPGGTLGNRNFVAHLAAFGLPMLLLGALRAPNAKRFLLAAAGTAVVVGVLVLTRSRAAWLAFAAAVLITVIGVVVAPSVRRQKTVWLRLFGMIFLAAVAVIGVVWTPNSLHWRTENPYVQSFKGVANYQEGSGKGRLIQYRRSLVMALKSPILGVGPGNWAVAYPKHAARRDPSLNNSQPGTTANPWPSSDWVAFISERGFIAAAVLLFAFFAMTVQSLKRIWRVQESDDALEAIAVIALLAATTVAGAFDAVLLLALPTLIVWPALGALWVPSPDRVVTEPPKRRTLTIAVVAIVVAIGALRSAAQLYAMNAYSNAENRSALV
jgi:hypothetical protein